jgi:phosphohistidine phosphatase
MYQYGSCAHTHTAGGGEGGAEADKHTTDISPTVVKSRQSSRYFAFAFQACTLIGLALFAIFILSAYTGSSVTLYGHSETSTAADEKYRGGSGNGIQLLLLRHAKSSWAMPANTSDFDRALDPQGEAEAGAAGALLRRGGGDLPAMILASPSLRTRQTLDGVMRNWVKGWSVNSSLIPIVWDMRLYDFHIDDKNETSSPDSDCEKDGGYLSIVRGLNTTSRRVMVVGHNPSISQLAIELVKHSTSSLSRGFPTAAFAELQWPQEYLESRCPRGHGPSAGPVGADVSYWQCIASNTADLAIFEHPNIKNSV